MDIFRYDSDLMQGISRVADLAWLNILCFICSIPLITIGSAMTAKYYVAMKLERGEALGVTRTFFRNFKDNFRQNIVVSIILVLIYAFFALDWYLIIKSNASGMQVVAVGMLGMFSAMVLIVSFCIFPMISRFEMKNFDAFRNALVFGLVHFFRVVLGIFMAVIPFIIGIWYFKWAWLIWLFIACVALYYNSKFFIKAFDKVEERTFGPKETQEDPDYVLTSGDDTDQIGESAETEQSSESQENEDMNEAAEAEDKEMSEEMEETEESEETEETEDDSEDTEE